MVRRIFPWLLPAVLALASVVPMGGADAIQATTFERPADCDATSLAGAPIHQNDRSVNGIQWTDDDDDRISLAGTTTAWVSIAFFILPRDAGDILCRAFAISAAFPRGPPSA